MELESIITYYVTNIQLQIYLVVIVSDVIVGMARSHVKGNYSSTIGLKGIAKHVIAIVMGVIGYPLLHYWGIGWVAETFIIYAIWNYACSLLANLQVLGVPISPQLTKLLENEINRKKGD